MRPGSLAVNVFRESPLRPCTATILILVILVMDIIDRIEPIQSEVRGKKYRLAYSTSGFSSRCTSVKAAAGSSSIFVKAEGRLEEDTVVLSGVDCGLILERKFFKNDGILVFADFEVLQ